MAEASVPATRVYTSPGIPGRPSASVIIVTLAVFYGIFEIWRAWASGFKDQLDIVFGVFFVGGGLYGFYRTWTDNRDTVLTLDIDEAAGRASLGLWRPFRPLVIETRREAIAGWRHFVKLGPRDARTHLIMANCTAYPRPVRFELKPGQPVPEGLRKVAPEAVADYEEATGTGAS